jgi:hypothetical protein
MPVHVVQWCRIVPKPCLTSRLSKANGGFCWPRYFISSFAHPQLSFAGHQHNIHLEHIMVPHTHELIRRRIPFKMQTLLLVLIAFIIACLNAYRTPEPIRVCDQADPLGPLYQLFALSAECTTHFYELKCDKCYRPLNADKCIASAKCMNETETSARSKR